MVVQHFILQAATEEKHADALTRVFSLVGMERGILSIAFATADGVAVAAPHLRPVAARCTAFVGVRNAVTTFQGLRALLGLGLEVYAVDTGWRRRIFHPKVYLARSGTEARLLVGSANLTRGGLETNIEASLVNTYDLADPAARAIPDAVLRAFEAMRDEHPLNVIRVDTEAMVQRLVESGALRDEEAAPTSAGDGGEEGERAAPGTPAAMKLRTRASNRARLARPRLRAGPANALPQAQDGPVLMPPGKAPVLPDAAPVADPWILVWTSKPLKASNLSLTPSDSASAKTMIGLGGGAPGQDLDYQTYFRTDAMNALNWVPDPDFDGKEVAECPTDIYVDGIFRGHFALGVKHDGRNRETFSGRNQFLTSLYWRDGSLGAVRQEGNVGKTMRLSRDAADPSRFRIDID